jgi:hypothetical protein
MCPVRKLCLEGFCSGKRFIVNLSRALQRRLGGVLRLSGRLRPAIGVARHCFYAHVPYLKVHQSVCLRYRFRGASAQSWRQQQAERFLAGYVRQDDMPSVVLEAEHPSSVLYRVSSPEKLLNTPRTPA